MRPLLGFAAVVALLAAALAGCTSRNLAYEDDRDDAGHLVTHDMAHATVDLLNLKSCHGLDEQTCEAANCRVDRCDYCNCHDGTASFVACSDPSDPPPECPAYPCPADACAPCSQLDEKTCGTVDGCTPVYCPSQCSIAPEYQGCFGPNEGAPACPPNDDCLTGCRANSDCATFGFCLAPGASYCGDVCELPEICNGDFDCGDDQICDPVECACGQSLKACKDGCKSDLDCGTGQECEQRRCRAQTCSKSTTCPSQFDCSVGADGRSQCGRRECKEDSNCKSGYCVDGACYDELGMCLQYPG